MDKIRFCKAMRDARLVSEAGPPAGLSATSMDKVRTRQGRVGRG
jgi:hypothetical protein